MTFLFLACPLCGIGSGLVLFFIIFGLFALMFTGTIILFIGSKKNGDWKDQEARYAPLRAEQENQNER